MLRAPSFVVASAVLVAVVSCGTNHSGTGAPGADAGCDAGPLANRGTPGAPPLEHRAASIACGRSGIPGNAPDAATACTADAQCPANERCLHGLCGPDDCLSDADCSASQACACLVNANTAYPGNRCLPANCHVDGDCGSQGLCARSYGVCGAMAGYYCWRPVETCASPADCPCGDDTCAYSPSTGHWTCAVTGCAPG